MMRTRRPGIWICVLLLPELAGTAACAQSGNDARFFGAWTTSFVVNGQRVTMESIHDANGYTNYSVGPTGNTPAGNGTFFAANGAYKTSADKPNDAGVYHFLDPNTVVCTNAAGQTAVWRREKSVEPNGSGGQAGGGGAAGAAGAEPAAAQPAPYVPDPSLPPSTNAAIAAFNQKDYKTAWNDFMVDAQKGNAEAEAGIGAMLYRKINPPGTGYWAQCEKWLLASANQGNTKGMNFLGQYYFESARNIVGGINPGHNNEPISPVLQKQADARFALARQWFERAVAKNDVLAMANLAIMLDGGVGGPADPARAAKLREQIKHSSSDTNYVRRATADPAKLAMDAAWQSGHYADAIQKARAMAAKGDASAEAQLGRAYYEGVGVARDYATAMTWCNKAAAQNNADGMFFIGLMYEFGYGVKQDLQRALKIFDQAGALGQRYAQMEAKGMRMQGEADAQQARWARVCQAAGGVADGPLCLSGGMPIDPY
jgi:TPR repeat protein